MHYNLREVLKYRKISDYILEVIRNFRIKMLDFSIESWYNIITRLEKIYLGYPSKEPFPLWKRNNQDAFLLTSEASFFYSIEPTVQQVEKLLGE